MLAIERLMFAGVGFDLDADRLCVGVAAV